MFHRIKLLIIDFIDSFRRRKNKTNTIIKESIVPVNDSSCCSYCGEKIVGFPFYGSDGEQYCINHKVPESRGERGYYKYRIAYVTVFSKGKIQYKK